MERPTKDQVFEKYKPRKIFDVVIRDKKHPVYDIPDYEHENGKWNGTPQTWWLEYEDEIVPYVDKGINRICWGIDYKQGNSSKFKWDDWSFSSHGECIISANGEPIYSFRSRDLGYALGKAQSLIIELSEHPYNFLDQKSEMGRKIWYYGLPATVIPSEFHPGEINIQPDIEDSGLSTEDWWDLYSQRRSNVINKPKTEDDIIEEEYERKWRDYGKIGHGDALWDGMINWFRD